MPGGLAFRGAEQESRVVAASGGRANQNRISPGPQTIDPVKVSFVGKQEPIRAGVVDVSVNGHRAPRVLVRVARSGGRQRQRRFGDRVFPVAAEADTGCPQSRMGGERCDVFGL